MSAQYPVLPVAGGALLRVFASLVALVTHWLKEVARARRHRREANILAGLDRRMLADIGITRADVRDAFSEPFWDDPTALLRERALERRLRATSGAAAHECRCKSAPSGVRGPTVRRASHVTRSSKRPSPLIGRSIRHPRTSPLAAGSAPAGPSGGRFI